MRWRLLLALGLVLLVGAPEAFGSSQGNSFLAKKRKKRSRRRRSSAAAPKSPPVSPAVRAATLENVAADLSSADATPDNPAALVPFFEQLWRHQNEKPSSLHILHYGDSHTAGDDWTGTLRFQFQTKFGDGGGGYSIAGHPFAGYRRLDLRSSSSPGWYSDGLVGRSGDGMYGLGGVSLTATRSGQVVTLTAECRRTELYYLKQPGGGDLQFSDNGTPVERIATNGALGPGYFEFHASPGLHEFEVRTVSDAPVRLFGWVTENDTGLTYETLGINGAQASIVLKWDAQLLASHMARRNPALIVVAYGTNEAGAPGWTLDSYREMFSRLLGRLRATAPMASILVVGPPDRMTRDRRRSWVPFHTVGMIAEAQRRAALTNGCAFLDLRKVMGGEGSIASWVTAGLAAGDHVHFSQEGYRILAEKMFQSIMDQYTTFVRVRQQVLGGVLDGQASPDRRNNQQGVQ
jgi:lysophospholipase L1-like esterase